MRDRVLGHVALGVDEHMIGLAGGDHVDDLDRGDFDEPVALGGIEAGRLGVEHDLTHVQLLAFPVPTMARRKSSRLPARIGERAARCR